MGVDVGRRVFRAQYAIEAPLALTAGALLWHQAGGAEAAAAVPGAGLLAGAAGAWLVEAALVFPLLDLRGKALIASAAAAKPEGLSSRQQAYIAGLQRQTEGRALPPSQLHLASVLLAFARAGLLGAYVWQQMLALGA